MALSQDQIQALVARLRPYVDETGLHVPEYAEIKDTLVNAWRGIFGDDIYVEPDSQDGQLIAVFALALLDTYSALEDVYLGFSPSTASGEGLSRVVKINGIRRQPGSRSTVDVRIVGQPGTAIDHGVVRSTSGDRWDLPAAVVIPVSGEVTVTATAQAEGAVAALAGEVSEIATPTRGWQSVTNAAPAVLGAETESDAALRLRQTYSVAIPSRTIFEGVIGAVLDLPEVLKVRGYENDSDGADDNGIPAHSICIVAQGGSASDIAHAIWLKKTPGCGTYGSTTEVVIDSNGVSSQIRFSRPVEKKLRVTVSITPEAGYVAPTAEEIKAAIVKYVTTLQIGQDVSISRVTAVVISVASTFDIGSITMGIAAAPQASENVVIAYNELATCRIDDIEVETS